MLARWLSYSSWVLRWKWNSGGRENVMWWNGFTLKDVNEFEYGCRLIKILDEWKWEGKKIIIFMHAVFHQQYTTQVLSLVCKVDITGIAIDGL